MLIWSERTVDGDRIMMDIFRFSDEYWLLDNYWLLYYIIMIIDKRWGDGIIWRAAIIDGLFSFSLLRSRYYITTQYYYYWYVIYKGAWWEGEGKEGRNVKMEEEIDKWRRGRDDEIVAEGMMRYEIWGRHQAHKMRVWEEKDVYDKIRKAPRKGKESLSSSI